MRYVIFGNVTVNGVTVGAMRVVEAPQGRADDLFLQEYARSEGFDLRLGVVAVPVIHAWGGPNGQGPQ